MGEEEHARGIFQGQVIARLDNIDRLLVDMQDGRQKRIAEFSSLFMAHDTRLRSLEMFQSRAIGIVAVIAALGGLVPWIVGKVWK